MDLASAWENQAQDWIAWARAPGHDGFWYGTWPAFRGVLPPPAGLAIDLGCGEGRVCRELTGLGYRMVGVDRSATLTRAAKAASPGVPVALADAAALPFADGSAMLVIACMSMHDIGDLDGAIRERAGCCGPAGSCVLPWFTRSSPPRIRRRCTPSRFVSHGPTSSPAATKIT
jgi:SAM-dependent methyltransferase